MCGPDAGRVRSARTATALGVWERLYAEAGEGPDVSITSECTSAGPTARLGLRFGLTTFDRAIDLVKTMTDTDGARGSAARMGMLAGQLELDSVRGVEAELAAAEPDLVVWLKLREA